MSPALPWLWPRTATAPKTTDRPPGLRSYTESLRRAASAPSVAGLNLGEAGAEELARIKAALWPRRTSAETKLEAEVHAS